jgi:DNA repair photolyase
VKDWTWTVSTARLTGQSYILDPVQRRADWEAWRAALGAEAWPEHRSGIRTHLHAVAKDVDGLLDVAVIADLIEDEEESQEGS